MVVSMKFVVLSRIILQNQLFFFELIKQMASQWNIQVGSMTFNLEHET